MGDRDPHVSQTEGVEQWEQAQFLSTGEEEVERRKELEEAGTEGSGEEEYWVDLEEAPCPSEWWRSSLGVPLERIAGQESGENNTNSESPCHHTGQEIPAEVL